MFSGSLDYTRFEFECSICKEKQGSCITCDYAGCKKNFHVRCAIKKKFILNIKAMEKKLKVKDWDIKVYCEKHQIQGKKKVQKIKQSIDGPEFATNIVLSEEDELMMHKVETRLLKQKKNFSYAQGKQLGKRPNILQQINIDRILNDEKSMSEVL